MSTGGLIMITVRRFRDSDASYVMDIIHQNLLEVNSKDYGIEAMRELVKQFTVESIIDQAQKAHTYVAVADRGIAGCASIAPFWGSKKESIVLTVFVSRANHKQGIGNRLMDAIKQDEFFQRADRIEVPASKYAEVFYLKNGFAYKNGIRVIDEKNHIRMEIIKHKK